MNLLQIPTSSILLYFFFVFFSYILLIDKAILQQHTCTLICLLAPFFFAITRFWRSIKYKKGIQYTSLTGDLLLFQLQLVIVYFMRRHRKIKLWLLIKMEPVKTFLDAEMACELSIAASFCNLSCHLFYQLLVD